LIPNSRTTRLSFAYRLSKGKLNSSKQKNGGAGDEQNRVKGSEN
jgi:hypothetical protein